MAARWIIVGIILVTSTYAPREFWSEWRGRALTDPYRAPDWWPFDLLWWRALVRSGPAGTIDGPLVAAGYLVSGLDRWAAQQAVVVVLAVLTTIALALTVVVALYNRPRFLVAPHLRAFPGALAEARGAELPPEPRAGRKAFAPPSSRRPR